MNLSDGDRIGAIELYADYNDAIDEGRSQAWSELFARDGEFIRPDATSRGRVELAEFVVRRAAAQEGAPVTQVRHWNAHLLVKGDANTARGACDVVITGQDRATGKRVIVASGRYVDELVRHEGRWLFARRSLTID